MPIPSVDTPMSTVSTAAIDPGQSLVTTSSATTDSGQLKIKTSESVLDLNQEKFEDYTKRHYEELVNDGAIITTIEECPVMEEKLIDVESHSEGLWYYHICNTITSNIL